MSKITHSPSTRIRRFVAIAAATAAAAVPLATGGGLASAAPAQPVGHCSITYPTPNLFALPTSATASITQSGRGGIQVRLDSRPLSIAGYQQKVTVTWANLRTGKSGSVFSDPTRVGGLTSTVSVPRIATAPGRIALVIGATNTSSINPNAMTNGDCSTEYVVR